MPAKTKIIYVTSSRFKSEEVKVMLEVCKLENGELFKDRFEFEERSLPIPENLEVDLGVMVQHEVTLAYHRVRVPCIVEHAGLIFEDYKDRSYPGGLTKPMWDTLGDDFLRETNSAGRGCLARAVIAYCDGQSVRTFVGETQGRLAESPRGQRKFYWDTVFIPDQDGKAGTQTYAEIIDDPQLGLKHKLESLSQSSKAMTKFLNFRLLHQPELWT